MTTYLEVGDGYQQTYLNRQTHSVFFAMLPSFYCMQIVGISVDFSMTAGTMQWLVTWCPFPIALIPLQYSAVQCSSPCSMPIVLAVVNVNVSNNNVYVM